MFLLEHIPRTPRPKLGCLRQFDCVELSRFVFHVAGKEHSAPLLPFRRVANVAQKVLYPAQFVVCTDVKDLRFVAEVVVVTLFSILL